MIDYTALSKPFPPSAVSWRSQSLTKDGTKALPLAPISISVAHRQRDEAGIEKEENKHRGHPPVPFPPGSPGRLAPDRPGGEAERGEEHSRHGNRPRRDPGERMAPHELDESRDRERGPAPHAEPGGGHK